MLEKSYYSRIKSFVNRPLNILDFCYCGKLCKNVVAISNFKISNIINLVFEQREFMTLCFGIFIFTQVHTILINTSVIIKK